MGMLLARYSSQQPAAYTFGVNAICMIICINMNHLPSAQVLLLRWMTTLTFSGNVEFFEVFSGEAAVTKEWFEPHVYSPVYTSFMQAWYCSVSYVPM